VHTKHIGHLGWIEKIFITPMNHRIHHAKNKEYIDANYGGVFILWDRMFGTYKPELSEIEPVYGTVTPLRSWNPIWANFQVFYQMLQDSIQTKKFSDKIKVWYSKTYWRPEDVKTKRIKYDINERYNPLISSDIKYFALFQLVMIIILSAMILLTLSSQNRFDTAVFAISVTGFATLTGMLLQRQFVTYQVFLVISVFYLIGMNVFPVVSSIDTQINNLFSLYALFNVILLFCLMINTSSNKELPKSKEVPS
jgi:hypothetical protein